MNRLGISFILVAVLAGCTFGQPTPPPPAYWPTDAWRTATPEEQGLDSEQLAAMIEHIQKTRLNLHSLLIVRNGYLIGQVYTSPYSAEQSHVVMSVTKSVMDALVGIAL